MKSAVLSAKFLLVLAVTITTIVVVCQPGLHTPSVTGTFLIIIALGVAGILIDPLPYSLCQIFNLFCVIFMGLAPLSQYINGMSSWNLPAIGTSTYLKANVLIIICQIIFLFTANFRRKAPNTTQLTEPYRAENAPAVSQIFLVVVSIAAVLVAFWYYRRTPTALFNAMVHGLIYRHSPSSNIIIIDYCVRSLPGICLFICLLSKNRSWAAVAITAICTVICTFPTGTPRFLLAIIYLSPSLVLIPLLRKDKVLTLLLFLILTFVFVLYNLFRIEEGVKLNFKPFLHEDYDCYQLLLTAIDRQLITHGRQLLGVLLFFVPRAIWPTKPIGSGYLLSYAMLMRYNNISMPIFGEGYMNFGFAGALIFTALCALLFRWLDSRARPLSLSFPGICYLFLLVQSLYILRGAMLPTVGALCYILMITAMVYFPAKWLAKKSNKQDEY